MIYRRMLEGQMEDNRRRAVAEADDGRRAAAEEEAAVALGDLRRPQGEARIGGVAVTAPLAPAPAVTPVTPM